MTSKITEFLKIHMNLLYGTIIIGSAVIGTRYLKKKIIDWQVRKIRELLILFMKQQYFGSNGYICSQVIRDMSSNLFDAINVTVSVRHTGNHARHRSQITNKFRKLSEFKVLAFAHACTLVYAYAFLTITLRVMFNVIGGYMFKDTINISKGGQPVITYNLQQSYLSLCHYFMNEGVKSLFTIIHGKVDEVIGPVSLKKEHGLHDIEELFLKIQTSIASDNENLLQHIQDFVLFPDLASYVNYLCPSETTLLSKIFIETSDILESEDVRSLTGSLVCMVFSYYNSMLVRYFASIEHNGNAFPICCDPYNLKISLAKLIPILNSISKAGFYQKDKGFASDELLFLCSDEIKKFSENIYESFSN